MTYNAHLANGARLRAITGTPTAIPPLPATPPSVTDRPDSGFESVIDTVVVLPIRFQDLLTKADERLYDRGHSKLLGLLAAGDPKGEVKDTWHAKEVIRSIYRIDDTDLADQFVTRLGSDLQDTSFPPEVRSSDGH